jgi:hypothetical protein
MVSTADVLLPTFSAWGRPVRKARIQLQKAFFSPRVLSLVMSLEGTMGLNAELNMYTRMGEQIFVFGL